MMTKDHAICIRAIDYSETSQIVTFFTKATGKLGAIAKGSKRPKSAFDGAIEVFSHGKIVFSDSNKEKLAVLTEFEQTPAFTHLQSNLLALNCALFAAELLGNLTDDYDPHPQLFDSFLKFLQNVSQTADKPNTLVLLILFQLSLLREVGLQPILNACANCRTDLTTARQPVYFSNSINGLICRDCENAFPDKISLSRPAVDSLTNLKLLAQATPQTLKEIEKTLIHHFTELLHRPPKMAKYILKS